MKTYQPNVKTMKRSWHLIDADGKILGRLASNAAQLLTGKLKPTYSENLDSGDNVVILNAEKIKVTGRKAEQKVYRRHSGYPGGFKERSYRQIMESFPERIVESAINGMVPDNRLKSPRMRRLKVLVGPRNPFASKFK
ncbi:MAG: 50S ribosomal protein L13 [bacterium]|nr:50S ribosomal protein L13 [bacterium]